MGVNFRLPITELFKRPGDDFQELSFGRYGEAILTSRCPTAPSAKALTSDIRSVLI